MRPTTHNFPAVAGAAGTNAQPNQEALRVPEFPERLTNLSLIPKTLTFSGVLSFGGRGEGQAGRRFCRDRHVANVVIPKMLTFGARVPRRPRLSPMRP